MAEFQIYHVDDCMYVAATSAEQASAFVKQECGEGCGDPEWTREVADGMTVETANVDDGEQPTPTSKRLAVDLVREHLAAGGTLPWTVAHDNY
jgi:hypothetical protein